MSVPTRTVSTDKPLTGVTAGRATSLLVARDNQCIKLLRLEGYCYGTAAQQYWLMMFDATTVPVDGTRPNAKWQLLGLDGFTFEFTSHGLTTKALEVPPNTGNAIFVLSTTEDTLTIITGAGNNMALRVDFEEYELQEEGFTDVADATAAATAQVWADSATNLKVLLQAKVTNLEAGIRYLMLFAKDSPSNGDTPLMTWQLAATGDSAGLDVLFLKFGTNGKQVVAITSNNTFQKGCTLALSSTAGTLTAVTGAKGNFTQMRYK